MYFFSHFCASTMTYCWVIRLRFDLWNQEKNIRLRSFLGFLFEVSLAKHLYKLWMGQESGGDFVDIISHAKWDAVFFRPVFSLIESPDLACTTFSTYYVRGAVSSYADSLENCQWKAEVQEDPKLRSLWQIRSSDWTEISIVCFPWEISRNL